MYTNTLELMVPLALWNWNGGLGFKRLLVCAEPSFTTQIIAPSLVPWIENKHLVWAVYQTGLEIAQRGSGQHSELYAAIILRTRQLGFISYEKIRPRLAKYSNGTLILDGSHWASNTSTDGSRQRTTPHIPSSSSTVTANHGRVTDQKDKKLKIEYEFDGVKISPAQIFSAYLDALAIAAPHDSDEIGASIASWSADRRMSIIVRRNVSYLNFTWGQLIRALWTIWRQVIARYDSPVGDRARWEGMSFLIEYDGKFIGEGFLVCYDNPPHEIAVSRKGNQ